MNKSYKEEKTGLQEAVPCFQLLRHDFSCAQYRASFLVTDGRVLAYA
jgi:hypothetical protein